MQKMRPIEAKFCACGRLRATPGSQLSAPWTPPVDALSNDTSDAREDSVYRSLSASISTSASPTTIVTHSANGDGLSVLQLKIRALEKYKVNYELLCGQLAELNTQIGLQLQRHDVDVATLHQTVVSLQTANTSLERDLKDCQAQLTTQKALNEQDRAYSDRVHTQLATVAELLKAAEKRFEEQEAQWLSEKSEMQRTLRDLQQEDGRLKQVCAQTTHELEVARSQTTTIQEELVRCKRKYRSEVKELQTEVRKLKEELEAQRATSRQLKKHHREAREERDVLRKQLGHVKSDGSHLNEVLETQRIELQRQEKKLQQWRVRCHNTERQLRDALQEVEEVQTQLLSANEELVRKNAQVESLRLEARIINQSKSHSSAESESSKTDEIRLLKQQIEQLKQQNQLHEQQVQERVKQEEMDAMETQRRYRMELHQMRHLLTLNHQCASESSKDMKVLKEELSSVQELLRRQRQYTTQYQRHHHEHSDIREEMRTPLPARADIEKAVLQSAIMEQVRALAPSPPHTTTS